MNIWDVVKRVSNFNWPLEIAICNVEESFVANAHLEFMFEWTKIYLQNKRKKNPSELRTQWWIFHIHTVFLRWCELLMRFWVWIRFIFYTLCIPFCCFSASTTQSIYSQVDAKNRHQSDLQLDSQHFMYSNLCASFLIAHECHVQSNYNRMVHQCQSV